MDLEELREYFHEKDAKFSSKFHKIDSTGAKRLLWLRIIIGWIILAIILIFIISSLTFYSLI